MFQSGQALAPNYQVIQNIRSLSGTGDIQTWALELARAYVAQRDQGGVMPERLAYYEAHRKTELPNVSTFDARRGARVFQAELDRILGTGQTFDVAVKPSGSASATQTSSASQGSRSMAQSYGDYMRDAKKWLELAGMSTAPLSAGGAALTQALTKAKTNLGNKLATKCGDNAQQISARLTKGPDSVKYRLATCQSAQSAATAVQQANQAATYIPPDTPAHPFPWKLALAGAAGLGGLALLIALLARKKSK